MTFEDRLAALEPLGLTPRQTRFLALVALHSGYCVRRQYLAFAGVRYGKNVREFLDGLVFRGLALRFMFRVDRGHVYHVHARSLYRAIRQEENRNRRAASPALIARKLMLLDFVLSQPDVEWLATEEDKVQRFTQGFGVPESELPQRRFDAATDGDATVRYFTEKLPIFIAQDAPVPHLVYLAADGSVPAFERFLREHARLLACLSDWAVVCLMPRLTPAADAFRASFARFCDVSPEASQPTELHRYFSLRRRVEAGRLEELTVGDLHDYRAARRRLSGPAVERAYAAWRGEASSAVPAMRGRGRLLIRVSSHPYQQFGTMAGVA